MNWRLLFLALDNVHGPIGWTRDYKPRVSVDREHGGFTVSCDCPGFLYHFTETLDGALQVAETHSRTHFVPVWPEAW